MDHSLIPDGQVQDIPEPHATGATHGLQDCHGLSDIAQSSAAAIPYRTV